MNKILEFLNDRNAQLGYLIGCIMCIILISVVAPTLNSPVVIEKVIHDTICLDTIKIKATYYNPCKEQCDNNPLITSDGTKLNKHSKSVAISQNLRTILPYGSKIKLIYPKHLSGIYTVNDCMNKRFVNRMDIMVWKGSIKVDSVIFVKV